MNENQVALREFLHGLGAFAATSAIFIVFMMGLAYITSSNQQSKSSFEVVDKYKECDIVRYAPHQVAEYKYFLYCEDNK